MTGKPKPGFYVAVLLVVLGLVGVAVWRFSRGRDGGGGSGGGGETGGETAGGDKQPANEIDLKKMQEAEAPDSSDVTTVKEYSFVPSSKLPPIKGVSAYEKLSGDRVVKFAINVWAGWAPIIYANNGFKPGKVWKGAGGKDFKVELVLIDDPVQMRDAFAAGRVHVGWATVDMLPLLLEGLQKDSRTMPRVYQQIDWSNGGDGIVVRKDVKSIRDLKGKAIALAENSPSHFFVLHALLNGGVQPSQVDFKFTSTAFEAAAAFSREKSIAGCVSWAPDIYKLADVEGNKLLVTTKTANKLIADVWFTRADFAKDNPDITEGIVRGIFDAMIELDGDEAKQKVAKLMADGYSIPANETFEMLGDAHWTNYAENREFFMNANNPTNFERTYNTAYYLYGQLGKLTKVPFDQVMDFSIVQKLGKDAKYAEQKDTYSINFAPAAATTVQAESGEILTKTVVIHFFPNSYDLYHKVLKDVGGKEKEQLYDPNVDLVLEEIGKLAGQYGMARVVIEGHTDASMRGRIPEELVNELAGNRANAVKEALVNKFKTLQPNQFSAVGMGWSRPADPEDVQNHAKNRRVEIKVYPAEAQ